MVYPFLFFYYHFQSLQKYYYKSTSKIFFLEKSTFNYVALLISTILGVFNLDEFLESNLISL